jgi:adenosylcobinamide-GDP ribazoletransferase
VRRQAVLFMVAVQFLTRLPTPALSGYQAQWLSSSARYFPVVGVLVGVANVVVWWLAARVLPAAVSVGVMMAASLLVTGAFHEDGFADTCDGFGGGFTRERVLDIMKDSRIGAYGAIGIVMMLGLKWSTLNAMPAVSLPLLVVSAHMVSRWCATALIWRLPYVRVEADAKAKPFAHGQGGGDWLLSGVIGLVALCVVAVCVAGVLGVPLLEHDAVAAGALPLRACGTALLTAAVITLLAGVYIRQRIGGYTGDCLGAVQQLSELGFLMTGLAVLGHS